jgi:uncharacterized protein YdgA (DUF945 family)
MYENIRSNGVALLIHGISPVALAKGTRNKYLEIATYVRNREKMMSLNVQLTGVLNDPAKKKKIEAQLIRLTDANAQLSIAPLIESGEFSTIAEGLTEDDLEMIWR